MSAKPISSSESLEKLSETSDSSKSKRSRTPIVLFAYILSTFLYFMACRIQPVGTLAAIPFAIMAFLIPDFMVVKLLANPFTLLERMLLFHAGPFPLAFMLYGLLRTA